MEDLQKAYLDVYASQEIDEEMKPLPKEKMDRQAEKAHGMEVRAAAAGDAPETNKQMQRRIAIQDPRSRRIALQNKNMKEEFDLFDYLLEYLVAEGYADTNDNAIAIMANMSEDWRAEILDEAVRGSERSIADRITGNDIRGVTRGEKTVYKKPRSKDRAETQVRRDMGKEGHKTPYQHGSGLTKQAKASAERMNAIKNVEVKHDYDNHDVDVETTSSDSKSGYKTVPTDYRARKRRASGR